MRKAGKVILVGVDQHGGAGAQPYPMAWDQKAAPRYRLNLPPTPRD